jgi:hypothetical protein
MSCTNPALHLLLGSSILGLSYYVPVPDGEIKTVLPSIGWSITATGLARITNIFSEAFYLSERTNALFWSTIQTANTVYGTVMGMQQAVTHPHLAYIIGGVTLTAHLGITYISRCFTYNPAPAPAARCFRIDIGDEPISLHVDAPHTMIVPGTNVRAHSLGAAIAITHMTIPQDRIDEYFHEVEMKPAKDVRRYLNHIPSLRATIDSTRTAHDLLRTKFGCGVIPAARSVEQNQLREALLNGSGMFRGRPLPPVPYRPIVHPAIPGLSNTIPGISQEQISQVFIEVRDEIVSEAYTEGFFAAGGAPVVLPLGHGGGAGRGAPLPLLPGAAAGIGGRGRGSTASSVGVGRGGASGALEGAGRGFAP